MCNVTVQIDNFPFDLTEKFPDEGQVEVYAKGIWMGPITEETEAARLAGLKAAWVGADARRAEHAERLKKNRYEGPTHVNGMSKTHKENLSKAGMGNQNARKKPK